MKMTNLSKISLALAAGLLLSTAASEAALYHVSINTSALTLPANSSAGPFSVDFQLNSGDTLGNNTAVISNFSFTGSTGVPFGTANYVGAGVSGSLGATITLTDTEAFNEFYQSFTAGSLIQFDLNLTQNLDAGATPDSFSFAILDNSLANISTTGSGNSLLQLDINTTGPIAANLSSGTGGYSGISVTAVPEPSSVLCGVLACGLGILRRRRSA